MSFGQAAGMVCRKTGSSMAQRYVSALADALPGVAGRRWSLTGCCWVLPGFRRKVRSEPAQLVGGSTQNAPFGTKTVNKSVETVKKTGRKS
jgi:hypothetical protein